MSRTSPPPRPDRRRRDPLAGKGPEDTVLGRRRAAQRGTVNAPRWSSRSPATVMWSSDCSRYPPLPTPCGAAAGKRVFATQSKTSEWLVAMMNAAARASDRSLYDHEQFVAPKPSQRGAEADRSAFGPSPLPRRTTRIHQDETPTQQGRRSRKLIANGHHIQEHFAGIANGLAKRTT